MGIFDGWKSSAVTPYIKTTRAIGAGGVSGTSASGNANWPSITLTDEELKSIAASMEKYTNAVHKVVHERVENSEGYRMKLIAQRMRWYEDEPIPFLGLSSHVAGDKVHVFVTTGGKSVILEDDLTMFPSDTLITQLRMLE